MSIDNIRQINIVDLLSKHLSLQKKGANYQGLCPFHDEKTPSFSVNENKGFYKCFGCGASGDGIKFYQEKFNLTFLEACERIAKEHNIEFESRKISTEEIKANQVRHEKILFFSVVAQWYQEQLQNDAEALKYAKSRIKADQIEDFQIGFAPPGWNKLFEEMRKRGYAEDFLLTTGLFSQKDNGKVFDFFQNRLMFPIKTISGDIVAFGGRVFDNSEPKYLNSAESDIYHKGKILYGLFESAKSIREKFCVNIVEGYTDVTSLHAGKYKNTIALCGTAFTDQHLKLIQRYTHNVNLCLDNDGSGRRSSDKSAEMLIKAGFRVTITTNVPFGQDPDSFFSNPENEMVNEQFLSHKAEVLFGNESYDPLLLADNMREMARLLNMLKDVERKSMVDHIAAKYRKKGVNKKILESAMAQENSNNKDEDRHAILDESSLPDYVDRDEYRKYSFYVSQGIRGDMYAKNQYIFENSGRVSNFVMEPLFHVESEIEVKKIFKAVNKYGVKAVMELDLEALNSLQRFRKAVEEKGNYLFEGTDKHLMHLKRMWYDKTDYCKRIEYLGWQTEGFWAWANGITTMEDTFWPCDENGIIEYNSKKYFIAPYSSIYRNKSNLFTSERRFIYIKNDITLNEWLSQFIGVYGEQGMITFAFYLTTLFSDYIFSRENALPMLNIYGQKGTGKNEQAASLTALFGQIQDPCQIHNTTKAGLSAHLEEFTNGIAWIDEYKNSIPLEYIEILKAIYNRMGRNKKSLTAGFGKETTTVRGMGVITGQEMLTADIALFSRVICLMYYKTEFTREDEEQLEKLHEVQSRGLSHITARIIRNRNLVFDNYTYTSNQVRRDFEKLISTNQTDGRLLKNYVVILSTFKCLEKVLETPFTYADLFDVCRKSLLRQNDLMFNSNELSTFWSIIEYGVENHHINEGNNYRIKWTDFLKVKEKDGVKNIEFPVSKEVLLLKWAGIYQFYSETARRTSQHPLPESTLLHYLTSSSYFIGKVKSVKFDKETNQALAFDYQEIRMNFKRRTIEPHEDTPDDTERPFAEQTPSSATSTMPKPHNETDNYLPF